MIEYILHTVILLLAILYVASILKEIKEAKDE